MSSILEALKKLEDEKAARRGGIGNIAGKVASPGRRTGKRPVWKILPAMAAVALVAIFATYAAMKWLAPRHAVPAAVKATAPSPQAQAVAPQAAATTGADAASEVPISAPRVTAAGKPATESKAPFPPSAAAKPAPRQASPRRAPSAGETVPAPQPKDRLPVLTITGIAWQQQSASRLAVVNDIPVTEGSVVEGAQVKEIFPDHLRFSIQGKDLDVYMEKDPA